MSEPTPAPPTRPRTQTIRIAPARGWVALDLAALWQYRELLAVLVWRNIKLRYQQTALGVAWAILQPLSTAAVFSVFFGRLAKLPSDGLPYPLFALAALVPWTFFANALGSTTTSLVRNASLVCKVYFPRLILPLAALCSALVDLAVTLVLLVAVSLWYGIPPTAHLAWLPALVLLAMATTLAFGLWFGALNVRWRDVQQALPFLTQIWLFCSPVVYPSSLLAQPWRDLYALNPMVGVAEGFRWALFGGAEAPWFAVGVSALVSTTLLVAGAYYFRSVKQSFADEV